MSYVVYCMFYESFNIVHVKIMVRIAFCLNNRPQNIGFLSYKFLNINITCAVLSFCRCEIVPFCAFFRFVPFAVLCPVPFRDSALLSSCYLAFCRFVHLLFCAFAVLSFCVSWSAVLSLCQFMIGRFFCASNCRIPLHGIMPVAGLCIA